MGREVRNKTALGKLDILVRPSPFFLFVRLFIVHSVLLGLIILVLLVPNLFIRAVQNNDLINNFKIYSLLILVLLGEVFSLIIIARWVTEFYVIRMDSLTHRVGIFFKQKRVVLIRQIVEVLLDQSFIGKVFNYGTLKIMTPQAVEDVYVKRIENPDKYFRILRELSLSQSIMMREKNEKQEEIKD